MYGLNDNEIPFVDYATEYLVGCSHFPLPDHMSAMTNSPPAASLPPGTTLAIPLRSDYVDTLSAFKSEVGYNSSSGCSSYGSPTSFTSYGTTYDPCFIQRSGSSHSLQQINVAVSSPTAGYVESETSPVRKVLSTGDLQGMNLVRHNLRMESSPLSSETSIIEGMTKACRYSPEEKKERIERYRSKRNQRNFNKKIKYECRKTLADSRPRIRGRFARNDEIEKIPQNQWSSAGAEEDDEDEENWIHLFDSFSANLAP